MWESISAADAQRPQHVHFSHLLLEFLEDDEARNGGAESAMNLQCKILELVRAKAGQLRQLALVHVNLPTKHIDFPTVTTHSLCEKPARLRGNKAKLLDANTHTSSAVVKVSSKFPSDFLINGFM